MIDTTDLVDLKFVVVSSTAVEGDLHTASYEFDHWKLGEARYLNEVNVADHSFHSGMIDAFRIQMIVEHDAGSELINERTNRCDCSCDH